MNQYSSCWQPVRRWMNWCLLLPFAEAEKATPVGLYLCTVCICGRRVELLYCKNKKYLLRINKPSAFSHFMAGGRQHMLLFVSRSGQQKPFGEETGAVCHRIPLPGRSLRCRKSINRVSATHVTTYWAAGAASVGEGRLAE